MLHAILAVSSLHRDGLQSQAAQLKIAALNKLANSTSKGFLGEGEAGQNVATSMLLCSFEVGAKQVLRNTV
jgi:hypothetical protein